MGGDPGQPAALRQSAHRVKRTTGLERADLLQVFALEVDATAGDFVEQLAVGDGGAMNKGTDALLRRPDVVHGDRWVSQLRCP